MQEQHNPYAIHDDVMAIDAPVRERAQKRDLVMRLESLEPLARTDSGWAIPEKTRLPEPRMIHTLEVDAIELPETCVHRLYEFQRLEAALVVASIEVHTIAGGR